MSKPRARNSTRPPASSPPKRALSPTTAATAVEPNSPSKRARVDTFGVISPDKIVPKTPGKVGDVARPDSDKTFSDDEDVEIAPSQVVPDFSDEEESTQKPTDTVAATPAAPAGSDVQRVGQGRMDLSHLLDLDAVESNHGEDLEQEPEEDDGGSFVMMDAEPESTPDQSATDAEVIAKLLAGHPELLKHLKDVVSKAFAGGDAKAGDSSADCVEQIENPVECPSTPIKTSAAKDAMVSASPAVKGVTAPAVTAVPGQSQAVLGPGFDTDAVFDGVKSCLNASLWPPGLRSMYRAIVPPPRVVEYKSMKPDAYVTEADFGVWRSHPAARSLVKALKFVKNDHYVNICRVPYQQLSILDTKNVQYPMRYFTVDQKNAPALFVTVVEVRQSRLLTVHVIPKQDRSSTYDKKSLIAAPFSQELDLMVSTMGSTYESNIVHLPSWLTIEELRGFTFHTRIVPSRAGPVTRSSPTKRGKFNSTPVTHDNSNAVQPQLVGGQRVPVIDASASGFNFDMSFADLKSQDDMTEEPPAGSVGLVFYTVSDHGDWTNIEFNIQAFVMLAREPVKV